MNYSKLKHAECHIWMNWLRGSDRMDIGYSFSDTSPFIESIKTVHVSFGKYEIISASRNGWIKFSNASIRLNWTGEMLLETCSHSKDLTSLKYPFNISQIIFDWKPKEELQFELRCVRSVFQFDLLKGVRLWDLNKVHEAY